MKINKIRLLDKNILLIANRLEYISDDEFIDDVASNLKNGGVLLLLETYNNNIRNLLSIGKIIRELCSIYGSIFIIKSRVDVAMILHADGVHLLPSDIDMKNARELLGENAIIGCSIEEKAEIENLNADYFVSEKEIKSAQIPCFIAKKGNRKIFYKKN